MKYGLPYQGSKNKLAPWIIEHLPPADHFYDVFAGGCAVSHAAILSGKYGCVHFSDLNDSVLLFDNVLKGNVPDGSEWISREEFERRKDSDPYVRLVWSFGNNQRDYLYSRKLEPYKKAVHEMIFAPTPNERRLKFKQVCKLIPDVMNQGGASSRPRIYGAGCVHYPPQSGIPNASSGSNRAAHTPPGKRPIASSQWSETCLQGGGLLTIADRGAKKPHHQRRRALLRWGI